MLFDATWRAQLPARAGDPGPAGLAAAGEPCARCSCARTAGTSSRAARSCPPSACGPRSRASTSTRAPARDPDFRRGESAYDRYYGDPRVKPNPTLRALETPPFYALPVYPGDIGTNGGLATERACAGAGHAGRADPRASMPPATWPRPSWATRTRRPARPWARHDLRLHRRAARARLSTPAQTVASGVTGEPTAPGRSSGGAVSRKRLRWCAASHCASSRRYHSSARWMPSLNRHSSCSGSSALALRAAVGQVAWTRPRRCPRTGRRGRSHRSSAAGAHRRRPGPRSCGAARGGRAASASPAPGRRSRCTGTRSPRAPPRPAAPPSGASARRTRPSPAAGRTHGSRSMRTPRPCTPARARFSMPSARAPVPPGIIGPGMCSPARKPL